MHPSMSLTRSVLYPVQIIIIIANEKLEGKRYANIHQQPHILTMPRKSAVATFRLFTGHQYLLDHLHKMGIMDSTQCCICNEDQALNQEHLLTCKGLDRKKQLNQEIISLLGSKRKYGASQLILITRAWKLWTYKMPKKDVQ